MVQVNNERSLAQIEQLFADYGDETYEEACCQRHHAEQCATLAAHFGYDTELQIAAFLHDIGHFVAKSQQFASFDLYGFAGHAELGAEFLQQLGFGQKVVALVAGHVQAKRYLLFTDPYYAAKLSAASQMTAKQQGSQFSEAECELFRSSPWFAELIKLRLLDDHGKAEQLEVLPIQHWLALIKAHLMTLAPD